MSQLHFKRLVKELLGVGGDLGNMDLTKVSLDG
jgi:hypothetical protein